MGDKKLEKLGEKDQRRTLSLPLEHISFRVHIIHTAIDVLQDTRGETDPLELHDPQFEIRKFKSIK